MCATFHNENVTIGKELRHSSLFVGIYRKKHSKCPHKPEKLLFFQEKMVAVGIHEKKCLKYPENTGNSGHRSHFFSQIPKLAIICRQLGTAILASAQPHQNTAIPAPSKYSQPSPIRSDSGPAPPK